MADEYRVSEINLSEINYKYVFKDMLRRWFIIFTAAAILAMVGFVFGSRTSSSEYTSEMTLVATVRGSTNDAYSNLKTTISLSEVMNAVLESDALKQLVCTDLSTSSVPGKITSEAIDSTNLISLKASASSPKTAFKLVNSAYDNLQKVSDIIASDAIINVLDPADIQSYRFSLGNPVKYAVLFFALGIFASVALSFLMSVFDTSITSRKQLANKVNTKIFATVPNEKKKISTSARLSENVKSSMLITDLTRSTQYIESIKKLRVSVEKEKERNGYGVFCITSTFENEGKSTIASNLAVSLAKKGHKVLLIDADLRKPALFKLFEANVAPEAEIGLFLGEKDRKLCKLYNDPKTGVSLIFGTKFCRNSCELLSSEKMRSLVKNAKTKYEYIIIDTTPIGVVPDAEEILTVADAVILIVRENGASYLAVNDTIRHINEFDAKLIGCVYNREITTRVSMYGVRKNGEYGYKYGYSYNYGYGYSRNTKASESES